VVEGRLLIRGERKADTDKDNCQNGEWRSQAGSP
jgi:hypothetical protein